MQRFVFLVLVLVVAACGDGGADTAESSTSSTQTPVVTTQTTPDTAPPTTIAEDVVDTSECAHVIDATIEAGSNGFAISATVRSGDTGWDKYADLWEVRDPEGTLLGERVLAHPHETEQPFTRSVSGVAIPDTVTEVVIAARDSVSGFCGDSFTIEVPHP